MTTKSAFKAMYKAIGFSDDAATKLTDTEVVDSMPKLSRIKSARAYKYARPSAPQGGKARGTCHRRGGAQSCDCRGCCLECFPCFAHN